MEWEKLERKHISQEGSYNVETGVQDFALDHAAPIQMDMNALASGLADIDIPAF